MQVSCCQPPGISECLRDQCLDLSGQLCTQCLDGGSLQDEADVSVLDQILAHHLGLMDGAQHLLGLLALRQKPNATFRGHGGHFLIPLFCFRGPMCKDNCVDARAAEATL